MTNLYAARTWGSVLLVALTLAGCGRTNEKLARVSGKITMDGEPLANAFVQFIPISDGTTSYGKTDASGYYEMIFSEYEKGAYIGENRVEISTGDVASPDESPIPERVPAAYNRETTLTATVQPGDNTINFDLDSTAGKIVQPPPE